MSFVLKQKEFHTAFTCQIIKPVKNSYLCPTSVFFYASLAPKADSYRYKSRTAFILNRYKNECFVLARKPQ